MVAGAWFVFTAWWGMDAMPAGGHLGNGAVGQALAAENALRWHSVYPLYDWYKPINTYPAGSICHHPFGIYWLSEILVALFGHRDFIVNLPAVLMSTAIPFILWKLGKHAWGAIGGAAAVLGFSLLPIAVGYSIFHGLENTTIFGALLFYMGTARFQSHGRRRDLAFAVIGALFATSGDWAGYLALAPTLGWAFVRAFVLPSWATAPITARVRYDRWWALSVAAAVCTLMLWVVLFHRADKINDWLGAALTRGGGKDIPLSVVLESRRAWIEFSFTPLAIAIGKLAAPVALARFLWKRDDTEGFSLSMLFAATVQYVVFKQGADVHIFWPHYFCAYYALAFAQLVRTIWDVVAWMTSRIAPKATRVAPVVAMIATCAPSLLLAPDAFHSLRVWRSTGGRYDDKGSLIRSGADLIFVLHEILRPQMQPNESLAFNAGAHVSWEHSWGLFRDMVESDGPSPSFPFWVARASALGGDRMTKLAASYPLSIYGDVVVVKRGAPQGPTLAYSLDEHEPNVFQWMFTNNVEPVRTVPTAPDPFRTWEWRYHLGQAAEEPTAAPKTLDEIRIAHNAALARGDAATAERLREQILAQITREPEAHFDGGHELMGVRVTRGVQPVLESWFQAGGPTTTDQNFRVRTKIVRRGRLSLIPPDEYDREMAWPPPLSTKLWKTGFIYKFETVMNHRIGLERYVGFWTGGPPKHAPDGITLVEVE